MRRELGYWIWGSTLCLSLAGCGGFLTQRSNSADATPTMLPRTMGEKSTGYGYIPLDGLAVQAVLKDQSCGEWAQSAGTSFIAYQGAVVTSYQFKGALAGKNPFKPLFDALPDVTVRFAVAVFDANGGLTFGPSKVTIKDTNYRAVLDYVNVDAIPVSMVISAARGQNGIPLAMAIEDVTRGSATDITFTARSYDAAKDVPALPRERPMKNRAR